MDKESVILFGAEKNIEKRLDMLGELGSFNVIDIWDNFVNKKILYKKKTWVVVKPHKIDRPVPILILSSRHEKEIRDQLIKLEIPENCIKTWWYCFHRIKDAIIE